MCKFDVERAEARILYEKANCRCLLMAGTTYRQTEAQREQNGHIYSSVSEIGATFACPVHGDFIHWGHGEWRAVGGV